MRIGFRVEARLARLMPRARKLLEARRRRMAFGFDRGTMRFNEDADDDERLIDRSTLRASHATFHSHIMRDDDAKDDAT